MSSRSSTATERRRARGGSTTRRDEHAVQLRGVSKSFIVHHGRAGREVLDAVAGVDLAVAHGETLALVGASGSGKSTLGRIIAGLTRPSSGTVTCDGSELTAMRGRRLREARKRIGVVFQNPYGSLNPKMSVGRALAEPLRVWDVVPDDQIPREVDRLLSNVGLPTSYASRYPDALSGGERQRVAIARALSVRPSILLADEMVSSLDVSASAGLLNQLATLRDEIGLTVVFITHDLDIVRVVADRVAVMEAGVIVEVGATDALLRSPTHPYTKLLLDSQLSLPDPGEHLPTSG